MRIALVNPRWSFEGSSYFGCRAPHLPLELGHAAAKLKAAGHDADILDAHLHDLADEALHAAVASLRPDLLVITTAPTYLFWRCAQPELRVPRRTLDALAGLAPRTIAVGPHGSTAPAAVLVKLGVDAVVRGECDDVLAQVAQSHDWSAIPGLARLGGDGRLLANGPLATARIEALSPLVWPQGDIDRHVHHHHRFDREPDGPGAEVEASRGCPYACTFCAKEAFRDRYRRRPHGLVLAEIDGLIAQGVTYVYFIDEIFLPDRALLAGLAERRIRFGIQTRIDLWTPEKLQALGHAGCVSIEAGVESLSPHGRAALAKDCRIDTPALEALLIEARRHVPFVQANLIAAGTDDPEIVAGWRQRLKGHGVWANDPVPMFAYPGSPDYRQRWGEPDERAWERAHADYLSRTSAFSDLQDERPLPLAELEAACAGPYPRSDEVVPPPATVEGSACRAGC